ncbi:unnamed protein product [Polarella glacialis]|nr:unnamed protein product [Polarella glacialis]
MPDTPPPSLVYVMMVVVTNVLLAMALVGYPSKMYKDTTRCVQFWPMLGFFFFYVCMLRVMVILVKGPFYAKGECVNVDALLCSTERYAFYVFRTGFRPMPPSSPLEQSPTQETQLSACPHPGSLDLD